MSSSRRHQDWPVESKVIQDLVFSDKVTLYLAVSVSNQIEKIRFSLGGLLLVEIFLTKDIYCTICLFRRSYSKQYKHMFICLLIKGSVNVKISHLIIKS